MATLVISFIAGLCSLAIVFRLVSLVAQRSVFAALCIVGAYVALYSIIVQSYVQALVHNLPLPW